MKSSTVRQSCHGLSYRTLSIRGKRNDSLLLNVRLFVISVALTYMKNI